jgi:hypothetical protein
MSPNSRCDWFFSLGIAWLRRLGKTLALAGLMILQSPSGLAQSTDPSESLAVQEPGPLKLESLSAEPLATGFKVETEGKEDTEKWNVKLGGHVQIDHVLWANAADSIPNTNNYVNFRRLRLVADGTGYEVCDFRLQMTLEPEPFGDVPADLNLTPQVKDAFLSMNQIPYLGRLRVGNFFVPYSLEQVTNDTNNIFLLYTTVRRTKG